MATFSLRSRSGASNMAGLMMIAAFAVAAGFMYWLSQAAAEASPEVAAIEEPAEEPMSGMVTLNDFSTDVTSYVGQEVSMANIPVTSGLGPHSFWTSLTDANETAFLVHLDDALVAAGTTVSAGSTVELSGMVMSMSDSILNAWEAAGAFPGPADRIQAEFAETFLEINSVTETTPPGA